ncbi:carbonic anhydrase-related protein 10 [Caerostris darwini]|uniref:Carbonic anhydrase-related protein 10 n=1 Tax=Caerostris darwini TaxID=1538125 RepID=A0AAV4X4I1_9ARAC|nr:carbonic anhydrase-related protein 10 [Caerostris darwini]
MFMLRRLNQGDEAVPRTPLANNYRPPQPLYNRSVRTNVFTHQVENEKCFDEKKMFYTSNINNFRLTSD